MSHSIERKSTPTNVLASLPQQNIGSSIGRHQGEQHAFCNASVCRDGDNPAGNLKSDTVVSREWNLESSTVDSRSTSRERRRREMDTNLNPTSITIAASTISAVQRTLPCPGDAGLDAHINDDSIRPGETFSPSKRASINDGFALYSYIDTSSQHVFAITIVDNPDSDPLILVGVNSNCPGMNDVLLELVCGLFRSILEDLDDLRQNITTPYDAQHSILLKVVALAKVKINSHAGFGEPSTLVNPMSPIENDLAFAKSDNTSVSSKGENQKSTAKDLRSYLSELINRWIERNTPSDPRKTTDTTSKMHEQFLHLKTLHDKLVNYFGEYQHNVTPNITNEKLRDTLFDVAHFVNQLGDDLVPFLDNLFPPRQVGHRDNLVRRLKSISAYAETAAFLCSLATGRVSRGTHVQDPTLSNYANNKDNWTSRMTVRAVKPDAAMYALCECANCEQDYNIIVKGFPFHVDASVLSRAHTSRNKPSTPHSSIETKRIQNVSTTRQLLPKDDDKIQQTTVRDAIQYRIEQATGKKSHKPNLHGEIILVFELARLFPNLTDHEFYIASFKKPCALCATLMSSFGCFRHRKSHEKIYSSWRLPSLGYLRSNQMMDNVLPGLMEFQWRLIESACKCTHRNYTCPKINDNSSNCEELEPLMNPHVPKEAYIPASDT